jgi:hypothetical protein
MSFHVLDAIKKTKAQGFSSVKVNDLITITLDLCKVSDGYSPVFSLYVNGIFTSKHYGRELARYLKYGTYFIMDYVETPTTYKDKLLP